MCWDMFFYARREAEAKTKLVKISKDKYEAPVLKSTDLKDDIVTVKVAKYAVIDLPQTGDSDVLYVEGYDKPMTLNKTNLRALIDLFGDETDQWVGKSVKLVKAMAHNPQTGFDTETIRIRPAGKAKA